MNLIYLDQNILSDMRERKLRELNDPCLEKLKSLCLKSDNVVVYSYTHFDEIGQIKNPDFQIEHINLLDQLGAAHISPNDGSVEKILPKDAWDRYQETQRDNENIGINEPIIISELISRKISGLPIKESFPELKKSLQTALHSMLSKNIQEAKEIPRGKLSAEEYVELLKKIYGMEKQIEELPNMPDIELPNGQELGPKPFRETQEIKDIDFNSIASSEVITTLDEVFYRQNPNYNWNEYYSKDLSNEISRCYALMNWAGYYPDDFNRVKKRKDRFMASNNDMMHVIHATKSHVLISRDQAFLKKAAVCYEYLNLKVTACGPDCAINQL